MCKPKKKKGGGAQKMKKNKSSVIIADSTQCMKAYMLSWALTEEYFFRFFFCCVTTKWITLYSQGLVFAQQFHLFFFIAFTISCCIIIIIHGKCTSLQPCENVIRTKSCFLCILELRIKCVFLIMQVCPCLWCVILKHFPLSKRSGFFYTVAVLYYQKRHIL